MPNHKRTLGGSLIAAECCAVSRGEPSVTISPAALKLTRRSIMGFIESAVVAQAPHNRRCSAAVSTSAPPPPLLLKKYCNLLTLCAQFKEYLCLLLRARRCLYTLIRRPSELPERTADGKLRFLLNQHYFQRRCRKSPLGNSRSPPSPADSPPLLV